MEYTKDIVLKVNYGEVSRKKKSIKVLKKIIGIFRKHKLVTTIVSTTIMLIVIDMMLVTSFVQFLEMINI